MKKRESHGIEHGNPKTMPASVVPKPKPYKLALGLAKFNEF